MIATEQGFFYWVYVVDNQGNCSLVRCDDKQQMGKEYRKHAGMCNVRTSGMTSSMRMTSREIGKFIRDRGWKIKTAKKYVEAPVFRDMFGGTK